MSKSWPNRSFPWARAAVLASAALLAACGVKGDLKPPPGAEDTRPRGRILYPPPQAPRSDSDDESDKPKP